MTLRVPLALTSPEPSPNVEGPEAGSVPDGTGHHSAMRKHETNREIFWASAAGPSCAVAARLDGKCRVVPLLTTTRRVMALLC